MGTYRLEAGLPHTAAPQPSGWDGLEGTVLLDNARWFTQIRWVVVAALAMFGLAARVAPGVLHSLGLGAPGGWPWTLAFLLAAVNGLIVALLGRVPPGTPRERVVANIWVQIGTDLLVLTMLVYLVGPTGTAIGFAYLFHIALACIFFTRRHSFLVLLVSAALYLSTVALVCGGVLQPRSILLGPAPRALSMSAGMVFAVPAVVVWLVVWYLVSTISVALRLRDQALDAANRRLLQADEEINQRMLRVTHDLKAPFSGIETAIEDLRLSHWESIPPAARETIGRIELLGATLRARIGDILTLGNLRSAAGMKPTPESIDLRALLEATAQEARDLAAHRKVRIELAVPAGRVTSDPRQLRILFSNLLVNAVSYSKEGGEVRVEADYGAGARVRVVDRGIGISESALPHVFDDFYRSQEAARFNPQSTGLGLAIVRQVASNNGLTVVVDSVEGSGTTFEVLIP